MFHPEVSFRLGQKTCFDFATAMLGIDGGRTSCYSISDVVKISNRSNFTTEVLITVYGD